MKVSQNAVLKKAQKDVERQIREDFTSVDDTVLSQTNWVNIIKSKLVELAEENQTVMDKLQQNLKYQKINHSINWLGVFLRSTQRLITC